LLADKVAIQQTSFPTAVVISSTCSVNALRRQVSFFHGSASVVENDIGMIYQNTSVY
jgi:hypothetical protein